jgi:phosphosulfolactate synthase
MNALLASNGILTYGGGTLLEVAIVQQHCRIFMQRAYDLAFSAVEISDGTLPLPITRRRNVIRCAIDAGLAAVTEVGKKDPAAQLDPQELADIALQDLDGAQTGSSLRAAKRAKALASTTRMAISATNCSRA